MNKQEIKTSELYKMEQKTFKVNRVIEDSSIPEVSNRNVIHLGYNRYKHIVLQSGFYINLYYS